MGVCEDRVVDVILEKFHSLPSKCKPILRADGHHDWVPLSGILLTKGVDMGPPRSCSDDCTNGALG